MFILQLVKIVIYCIVLYISLCVSIKDIFSKKKKRRKEKNGFLKMVKGMEVLSLFAHASREVSASFADRASMTAFKRNRNLYTICEHRGGS